MTEPKESGLVAWVFLNPDVHGKYLSDSIRHSFAERLKESTGIAKCTLMIGVDAVTLHDPVTHEIRHLKPQLGAGVTLSAFSIHEKLDGCEFTLSAPDLAGIEALLNLRKGEAKRGREFL